MATSLQNADGTNTSREEAADEGEAGKQGSAAILEDSACHSGVAGLNSESTGEPAGVWGKDGMGSNRYLMKVDMAALWVWLALQTGDRWSRWTREEGQGWGWTEKSVLSICSLRSWWQEASVHPAPAFRLLVPREIHSLSGTSAVHHMETQLSNRISSFIKLKGTQAPLHTYKFHTSLMASYTAHYHHTIN